MSRTRYNDSAKFLKEIHYKGVKGVLRLQSRHLVLVSYKTAGNEILDYQECPDKIDRILEKVKEFCEKRGFHLWSY